MAGTGKRFWALAGILLVVGLLVLAGCSSKESPGSPVVSLPEGVKSLSYSLSGQQVGIWVNGEGKVRIAPDMALLQLGVESQETTVAQAQETASKAMNTVMAALTTRGVAAKDIQTRGFSIQPVTQFLEKERKEQIIGYRVTNTVVAKIRKLDEAGAIIDAVAAAGGDLTRISGISFTMDDTSPLQKEAREKAIKDAMAKAQQMAGVAGIKLGKLVYMTGGGGIVAPPQPIFSMKLEAGAGSAAPSISPGEMEISVTVQMVFAIE